MKSGGEALSSGSAWSPDGTRIGHWGLLAAEDDGAVFAALLVDHYLGLLLR